VILGRWIRDERPRLGDGGVTGMPAGYRTEHGGDMARGEGTLPAFLNPALQTTIFHGESTGRTRER
jgi:hypothetical protein